MSNSNNDGLLLTQERAAEIRRALTRALRLSKLASRAVSELDATVSVFWNPSMVPAPRWTTQDAKRIAELLESQLFNLKMTVASHLPQSADLPPSKYRS